jgi:hypothetical protein
MVDESAGAVARDMLLGPLTQQGGGQYLVSKDRTGRLLGTVTLFESVEKWTLHSDVGDGPTRERVRVLLEDLERVLNDYSHSIPTDNLQVVQLLTSLAMRTMLQVVDHLSRVQPEFFYQFISYTKRVSADDLLAFAAVRRFEALMVSGWADRAFNEENAQYIINVLGGEEMAA